MNNCMRVPCPRHHPGYKNHFPDDLKGKYRGQKGKTVENSQTTLIGYYSVLSVSKF